MLPDTLGDDPSALLNHLERAVQNHADFPLPEPSIVAANTPVPHSCTAAPSVSQPETASSDEPAPSTAGRPRLITPEKLAQFCDLLRLGLSRTEAARIVGVSIRTLYNHERDNPDLAEAIQQAMGASDTRAYRSVARAGDKSWRAAAWLIDHKTRQERRPNKLSAESLLKSPRLKELLRELICEAVIANEISVDPGVVRRKKRLTEVRSEIESCRRRGEEAVHLLKIADDLTRDIAKTLRLAMNVR